jgi:hypothetical protein
MLAALTIIGGSRYWNEAEYRHTLRPSTWIGSGSAHVINLSHRSLEDIMARVRWRRSDGESLENDELQLHDSDARLSLPNYFRIIPSQF